MQRKQLARQHNGVCYNPAVDGYGGRVGRFRYFFLSAGSRGTFRDGREKLVYLVWQGGRG
jgi:hypothetical protein